MEDEERATHEKAPEPGVDPGPSCEVVGDYFLSKILGTGSYGVVRLGLHRTSREELAVKVMPKQAEDANSIKRISSEIATMEKIGRGCPFIVQLHEVLIGDHHIYLVMECAMGGELFRALKPLSSTEEGGREAQARYYFQQLIMGVQWCHTQGMPQTVRVCAPLRSRMTSIQRPASVTGASVTK
jgi:serine/threonine protein kinase